MSNKDKKRRGDRRNNKNSNKRGQGPKMTVTRAPYRIQGLRVNNVIEFQGQPMMVRAVKRRFEDGIMVGVELSLSRANERPSKDSEIKVGRSASKSYEAWSFTTRPISGMIVVDRFVLTPETAEKPRTKTKRRKRAGAADRISA